MKNRFFHLLLLVILVLIHARVTSAANYGKSGEFRGVKLTYDDMSVLLERTHGSA